MAFNFTAEWCKGAKNQVPDAMSRSPIEEPQLTEILGEQDEDSKLELSISELRAITNDGAQESIRLQNLHKQAEKDHEYQALKEVILKGFPDHKKNHVSSIGKFVTTLHLMRTLLFTGATWYYRHEAHQGAVHTKQ